jgi:hypothetical protein
MITFKIPDITTAKYVTYIYIYPTKPTKPIKISTILMYIYSLYHENYNNKAHIKLQ